MEVTIDELFDLIRNAGEEQVIVLTFDSGKEEKGDSR